VPLLACAALASDEDVEKARKRVDKEFTALQKDRAEVWLKVEAVKTAGPTDDLHDLIQELEKTVSKVRTGGLFGSGAKGHRKALEEWRELTTPDA
jgi:hypothetical protein